MLPGHTQTLSMGGEGNPAAIPSELDTQGGIFLHQWWCPARQSGL